MQTTPDIKYFHQLASLAEYRLLNPQITTPLCHTQDLLGEIKEEILSLFPQHSVNTGAAPSETKNQHGQSDNSTATLTISLSAVSLSVSPRMKRTVCVC